MAADSAEPDLVLVTMVFDGSDPEAVAAILARYVVVTRGHPGCRNVDLCASVTRAGRFVVIEKWETGAAQRAHFDSADMVEMATSLTGLLIRAPEIDLLGPISAHDLH